LKELFGGEAYLMNQIGLRKVGRQKKPAEGRIINS